MCLYYLLLISLFCSPSSIYLTIVFHQFLFQLPKEEKIFRYLLRIWMDDFSNIQFVSISKFTYYNLNSFNAFHRVFEWLEIISSVQTINFRHIYFHFDGESFSDNHQRPRHDGIHCLVTFNFEHKISYLVHFKNTHFCFAIIIIALIQNANE